MMGPPGGGKGTQAQRLVRRTGCEHISTGYILRAAVNGGSPLGERVAAGLQAGKLVPDEVMMELVRKALAAVPPERGWLLDGFPRTAPQAEGLLALVRELGQEVAAVVSLDVSDDEIVQRLKDRLTCPGCGFVTVRGEMEEGEACPRCGAGLGLRDDDRPETVRHRLQVYREETLPAQGILSRHIPLRAVDGSGDAEEVFQRIVLVLEAEH